MTRKKNVKAKSKLGMPQMKKVKGRGDYADEHPSATLKRIEGKIDSVKESCKPKPVSAGGMIGRGLGSLMGQGDLGASAGDAISKWFGYGDYELKTNSLIKAVDSGADVPVFSKDGRRGTRIVEREYIGDVVSSATSNTFDLKKFRINPADGATFPWLSVIASQYDEWEPRGIIFEYKTTSGTFNGTTQALGTVIAMTDYDPLDPPPFSKLQMENADYSNSVVSCNNLRHGVECDPNERPTEVLFTSAATPSEAEARFSDLGNFHVATTGVAGTSVVLGELWVSYDIVFYKKQLMGGQLGLNCGFQAIEAADPATVSGTYPLGTSQNIYGNLGVTYNVITKTLYFPPTMQVGRYWVYAYSAGTLATLDISTITNCSLVSTALVPPMYNATHPISGAGFMQTLDMDSTTERTSQKIVQITKAQASVLLSAPSASEITAATIWIVQLPLTSFDVTTQ